MADFNDGQGRFGAGRDREPVFNVPVAVLAAIAGLVAVQAVMSWVTGPVYEELLLSFAFSPARYAAPLDLSGQAWPGGEPAKLWSFFSYALLHGGWAHLAVNCLWMLAFGTVVARRLGSLRFFGLSLLAAAGGAGVYMVANWGSLALLVGASGAVSGQMGAAVRLMFAMPGQLADSMRVDLNRVRPLTLGQTLTNSKAMGFIAIWLVINVAFGLTGIGAGDTISHIAWEAHIGGFLAGLFGFSFFERRIA